MQIPIYSKATEEILYFVQRATAFCIDNSVTLVSELKSE